MIEPVAVAYRRVGSRAHAEIRTVIALCSRHRRVMPAAQNPGHWRFDVALTLANAPALHRFFDPSQYQLSSLLVSCCKAIALLPFQTLRTAMLVIICNGCQSAAACRLWLTP